MILFAWHTPNKSDIQQALLASYRVAGHSCFSGDSASRGLGSAVAMYAPVEGMPAVMV